MHLMFQQRLAYLNLKMVISPSQSDVKGEQVWNRTELLDSEKTYSPFHKL